MGRGAQAERIRLLTAPLVALLASCLAVTSAVSIPDVQRSVLLLYVTNERWVGWAGVAVVLAVGVAAATVLLAPRVGAPPALAFGAAAAVFGLALGDDIRSSGQVVLALLALGVAFGALVAGAGLVVVGLPRRLALLAGAGWAVPLVAGWPVTTWLALHGSAPVGRLSLHPPVWLLLVVTGVLVAWSSLAVLLTENDPSVPATRATGQIGWTAAWFLLVFTGVGLGLVLMVLGFDPTIPADWARAVAILSAAGVAVGLGAVTRWLPYPVPRAAYAATVVVLTLVPTVVQLTLMTTDGGDSRVSGLGLVVLVAAALLGGVAGHRRPRAAIPLGLLTTAGGAAGSWVLPTREWPMIAGTGFVLLGAGAALLGAARLLLGHRTAWRFLTTTAVVATATGLAAATPLSWALGGSVASSVDQSRAAGRIALGILFAAAVVAAAVAAIQLGRVPDPPADRPAGGPRASAGDGQGPGRTTAASPPPRRTGSATATS